MTYQNQMPLIYHFFALNVLKNHFFICTIIRYICFISNLFKKISISLKSFIMQPKFPNILKLYWIQSKWWSELIATNSEQLQRASSLLSTSLVLWTARWTADVITCIRFWSTTCSKFYVIHTVVILSNYLLHLISTKEIFYYNKHYKLIFLPCSIAWN